MVKRSRLKKTAGRKETYEYVIQAPEGWLERLDKCNIRSHWILSMKKVKKKK